MLADQTGVATVANGNSLGEGVGVVRNQRGESQHPLREHVERRSVELRGAQWCVDQSLGLKKTKQATMYCQ